MTDTLHDALDEAWRDLITRCRTVGQNGEQIAVDQHIEALVAASKWAEIRAKIAPPAPDKGKSSKFSGIKDAFHGNDKRRRRPSVDREADGDGIASDTTTEAAPAVNGAAGTDEAGPVN